MGGDKSFRLNSTDPRWGKVTRSYEESAFLEGPRRRISEFARAVRIFAEFIKGFRALHFVGPCVTVFGSARFKEDHPHYILARRMGSEIAKLGFTQALIPFANKPKQAIGGLEVIAVRRVEEAVVRLRELTRP